MNSKICPTCGCSLVRLGISEQSATILEYDNESYFFCCSACAEMFGKDAEKYIKEIENVIVCPVCLAEKTLTQTIKVAYSNTEIPFCRCPHCVKTFKEKPQYYLDRLSEKIKYGGLFNDLCC